LRVRMPPGTLICPLWVCVLSGSSHCVWLITRPVKSCRLWCVSNCVWFTNVNKGRPTAE
jgi:hypothetical protein